VKTPTLAGRRFCHLRRKWWRHPPQVKIMSFGPGPAARSPLLGKFYSRIFDQLAF